MIKPIYLDYQSTTPTDKRVVKAMLPYFTTHFANPSSSHKQGRYCDENIQIARSTILQYIQGDDGNLTFTGSATEAINIIFHSFKNNRLNHRPHIITQETEHKAVLECCKDLELPGCDVTYLPVDENGAISIPDLENAITANTVLVSIMHANNEIGTIHPITEIGAICRKHGVKFMVDASQSAGRININVQESNIDYLVISGHKMYGPKGIAALYSSREGYALLQPFIFGGHQEKGIRSGTSNVPGIIGLTTAFGISLDEQASEKKRIEGLRNYLLEELQARCGAIKLNGSIDNRLYNNLNIFVEHVPNNLLLQQTEKYLSFSAGSACLNTTHTDSYVLHAIGLNKSEIRNSIRISPGRFTTEAEIMKSIEILSKAILYIRKIIKP